MQTLYARVLTLKYAIWGVYLLTIVTVYLVGYIVHTLSIRWFLIPETLIVVAVSIVLSLAVSIMFILGHIRGYIPANHWLGLVGALPSILIVCATFFYILARMF